MCYYVEYIEKLENYFFDQYGRILDRSFMPASFLFDLPFYFVGGFEHPKLPVVHNAGVEMKEWGLIPFWTKDATQANDLRVKTLNAVGETAFEKPSFRNSITKNRCLVIADGFFEWMDFQKKKYPHHIYVNNHQLFCFAGIYSSWTDKETGELINSFSIITTDANPMMARIHNLKKRMPVILHPEQYNEWLKKDLSKEQVQSLLQQFPEKEMGNHTISKLITSRTENSNVPEVTEAFVYSELSFNSLF